MSKVIKKQDITNLVESTMKEAGLYKEDEVLGMNEIEEVVEDEEIDENCDDTEKADVVEESVSRLAENASEHNIISENLKKDLASFNKIINYKY